MKILFVHHSIGRYCLSDGLRSQVAGRGLQVDLWDIDNRHFGVRDGTGSPVEVEGLSVPGDNTNPDGLRDFVRLLFAPRQGGEALSSKFDGIILKSCYTGARIWSTRKLDSYKAAGKAMVDTLLAQHYPALILTPVPDTPLHSLPGMARRAAEYAGFMSHAAPGGSSVRVANLHESMGDARGYLQTGMRRGFGFDAHPNRDGIAVLSSVICNGLSSLAG